MFPEVVEKVILTPIPDMKDSFILTELSESDLPKQYPKASASLVFYIQNRPSNVLWSLDPPK